MKPTLLTLLLFTLLCTCGRAQEMTKLMILVKDGLTGETVFSQKIEEGEAVEVSLPN